MKKIISLLCIAFLINGCGDCLDGEGVAIDEKRTVEDYEVIYASGSFDVTIRQTLLSDQNKIVVHAQENLLPFIQTRVEGSRLVIESKGCISATEAITIEVITNGVTKIVNEGSGSLSSVNELKTERLKVQNIGSGNMMIKASAAMIKIENEGSGDVRLLGEAQELEIISEGSGDVNTLETRGSHVEVSNDGSGQVSVSVKDVLGIELYGSGDVNYAGNPQDIEQSVSGSGNVKRLN
ncbi:MAG: hypothetical protein ACJAU0_000897 [Flavobacteriales bacterium]|jgi:hypothetical protein